MTHASKEAKSWTVLFDDKDTEVYTTWSSIKTGLLNWDERARAIEREWPSLENTLQALGLASARSTWGRGCLYHASARALAAETVGSQPGMPYDPHASYTSPTMESDRRATAAALRENCHRWADNGQPYTEEVWENSICAAGTAGIRGAATSDHIRARAIAMGRDLVALRFGYDKEAMVFPCHSTSTFGVDCHVYAIPE